MLFQANKEQDFVIVDMISCGQNVVEAELGL